MVDLYGGIVITTKADIWVSSLITSYPVDFVGVVNVDGFDCRV